MTSSRPRTPNHSTPLSEAALEHVRGGAAPNVNEDATAEVMNNPLYEASGGSGSNPLYSEAYELL